MHGGNASVQYNGFSKSHIFLPATTTESTSSCKISREKEYLLDVSREVTSLPQLIYGHPLLSNPQKPNLRATHYQGEQIPLTLFLHKKPKVVSYLSTFLSSATFPVNRALIQALSSATMPAVTMRVCNTVTLLFCCWLQDSCCSNKKYPAFNLREKKGRGGKM